MLGDSRHVALRYSARGVGLCDNLRLQVRARGLPSRRRTWWVMIARRSSARPAPRSLCSLRGRRETQASCVSLARRGVRRRCERRWQSVLRNGLVKGAFTVRHNRPRRACPGSARPQFTTEGCWIFSLSLRLLLAPLRGHGTSDIEDRTSDIERGPAGNRERERERERERACLSLLLSLVSLARGSRSGRSEETHYFWPRSCLSSSLSSSPRSVSRFFSGRARAGRGRLYHRASDPRRAP